MTKQVELPEPVAYFDKSKFFETLCFTFQKPAGDSEAVFTADQMRQFREDGVMEALAGMTKLNSSEQYWVRHRSKIIDCLEKAGYTLMSNQNGFFLHPKIGMGIAQSQAKGE